MNSLSMRMTRFRLQAGLLSREVRSGSEAIEAGYKCILRERCFQENSTPSFGRFLTSAEIKKIQAANKGHFSQKSKNNKSTMKNPRKRKRGEIDDAGLSDLLEGQGPEPRTDIKRVCRTKDGEETQRQAVGTMMLSYDTGLLTPALLSSSYPTSHVGTPTSFSGVSPEAMYDEETDPGPLAGVSSNHSSIYEAGGNHPSQAGAPTPSNDILPTANYSGESVSESLRRSLPINLQPAKLGMSTKSRTPSSIVSRQNTTLANIALLHLCQRFTRTSLLRRTKREEMATTPPIFLTILTENMAWVGTAALTRW